MLFSETSPRLDKAKSKEDLGSMNDDEFVSYHYCLLYFI